MLLNLLLAAHLSQSVDFAKCGLETLQVVKREFRLDRTPGYAEKIGDGKLEPVFNWGAGVLLSALNAAAKLDPKWKKDLREFVQATRAYWNPAGAVPGYDVWPMPKPADRYYDDNAWMAMALVEASDVLKDRKILGYAEAALKFVLSGQDERLGGGIYWRENEKKSKNACSNGPAAAACLAVYSKTKKPELLQRAKEIFDWTVKSLQDPADSLFWDNVSLTGKIEKTKWSYNTALMIRTASLLAKYSKDPKSKVSYRDAARKMADQSEKRWFVDRKLADVGRFAHLLLECWTYVPSPGRARNARAAMAWLWEHGHNERGLFGPRFNQPAQPGKGVFELIDQASAARALLVLALQERNKARR